MDKKNTLNAFSALSQEIRLDVIRLLIRAGKPRLLSREISFHLSVRQNTMSTSLAILLNTALIRKVREGRAVRYFANYEGIRGILAYLMEDCCGGQPKLCQPVIEQIVCEF